MRLSLLKLPAFGSRSATSLMPSGGGFSWRGIALRAGVFILAYCLFLGAGLFSQRFESLLTGAVEEAGMHLVLTGAQPVAFPPGVKAEQLRLFGAGGGVPLFVCGDATVRLSPLALLAGRMGLNVEGTIWDGTLSAEVSTGFFFDASTLKVRLDLVDIPLQHLRLAQNLNLNCTGGASGTLRFSVPFATPLAGEGEADLHVAGLGADNPVPLLKGARVTGLTLDLAASWGEQRLEVESLRLADKDLDVRFQGGASLDAARPMRSTFDLNGTIKAPAARMNTTLMHKDDVARLKRGEEVAFRLTGPFSSPRFQRR